MEFGFNEAANKWQGHEYLIDTKGRVWSIDYDAQELLLVKADPGTVVIEKDTYIRRLDVSINEWLLRFRHIKILFADPQTDIIKFDYI